MDEIDYSDGAEMMEEHAVVNAAVNVEVEPIALDDETWLRLAGYMLHHLLCLLDSSLLGSRLLLGGWLLL